MSQSDLVHVDVAIVGGGMSGAVLALSLAALKGQDGAPLQILLLEEEVEVAEPRQRRMLERRQVRKLD
jgi:2-octaprenyl-6-methoxyphenol hydroxylase